MIRRAFPQCSAHGAARVPAMAVACAKVREGAA